MSYLDIIGPYGKEEDEDANGPYWGGMVLTHWDIIFVFPIPLYTG